MKTNKRQTLFSVFHSLLDDIKFKCVSSSSFSRLPCSYDVIFLAPWDIIIEKFKESKAKVLFGAENFCWPDDGLKTLYPPVESDGQKYLNSGLFIGYAANIINILNSKDIKDTDDDQLFYTNVYLNKELREENGIKLDHKSNLFQNLNGNVGELVH